MQAVSFTDNMSKDTEEVSSDEESEKESEKGVEKEIKKNSFLMAQPHTLNYVDLQLGEVSNIATDHPSIQTIILLDDIIKGRDYSAVNSMVQTSQVKEDGPVVIHTTTSEVNSEPAKLEPSTSIAICQSIKQQLIAQKQNNASLVENPVNGNEGSLSTTPTNSGSF